LWLVIKEPGHREPRRIPIEKDKELLLGSAEAADVRLTHPTVSGHHARLSREEKRLVLRDESRNGTFVNGVPIEACALPLGVPVRIGPYELHAEAEREPQAGLEDFYGILTSSENMKALFPLIARIAQEGDRSVVVHGESGTGKEAVVRALHALSPRAGGPFVALNCAEFADLLLEAELFGATKGSYTGCVADRDGVFVQADGGTLFLDEVGELSASAQAKLLRVVQEGTVRPVGSTKTLQVDVRIVAATHRDLKHEVEARRFREDLFYRLFVLGIEIPPLRERGDDSVLLFEHFRRLARPHRHIPAVSAGAKAALRTYDWPGNVRELKNVAERSVITAGIDGPLAAEALNLGDPRKPAAAGAAGDIHARGRRLDEVERQAIALAMRDHHGQRKSAAEQLGISPTTLLSKLRDYGLEEEGKG
jgi:DNA-binding NtrC family response regulator